MIRGHTISIIGGDKTPMFGQSVCLSLPSIGPQHSDRDLSVVDAQRWYCAMKGDGITFTFILLNISRAVVEEEDQECKSKKETCCSTTDKKAHKADTDWIPTAA